MQRLSGSNPRSQAPPQDEDRAGQAPRQPQPGRHRVLLLTMTDYARNHAQLPQVRGALAGDLSLATSSNSLALSLTLKRQDSSVGGRRFGSYKHLDPNDFG